MSPRTAVPPHPSSRVAGRALPALARLEEFEIRCVLAHSSFAVVYEAVDTASAQPVAIKEYLPEALALRHDDAHIVPRAPAHAEAFEQGLQAFVGEAELLQRCAHRALLRVRRVLRCHGTVYRVMPYCPWPTLLEHRRRCAVPPRAQTLRAWLDELLGALQTLHAEGCVHGAVAPANVLLQPDGRPLLLDLDAVRGALLSERTQSMMAALEPCFEPIEQRAPVSYMVPGPWTDLYSLAATLHFGISGQLPPPPHAPSAMPPFAPLGEVWQRLRDTQPGLDAAPDWLHALDACLSDEPQQRPQSVAQFAALLDARPLPAPMPAAAARRPAPTAQAEPCPPPAPAPEPTRVPEAVPSAMADAAPAAPASATPSRPAATATSLPRRRRLRPAGAAALLALAVVLGVIVWPSSRRHEVDAAPAAPPAADLVSLRPSAPPAPVPPAPVPPAPVPEASAQDAPVSESPAPDAPPLAAVQAPLPPPVADVAPHAAAPSPEPSAARAVPGPRERCAGHTGYELLQCMRAQCAKKALAPHEQCRLLRERNRLS